MKEKLKRKEIQYCKKKPLNISNIKRPKNMNKSTVKRKPLNIIFIEKLLKSHFQIEKYFVPNFRQKKVQKNSNNKSFIISIILS